MNCPECKSSKIQKNRKKRGKQNYVCVQCGRQFITEYDQHQGYSDEFKNECLKLYVNGMGFRAIERVILNPIDISHNQISSTPPILGDLGGD